MFRYATIVALVSLLQVPANDALYGRTGAQVLSVTHPAQALTNSTASDQDYTSIYTIPANYIVAQKVIRVTLLFQFVTDGGPSTPVYYLKLGSTKVFTGAAAATPAANATRGVVMVAMIFGTAAAGASANVDTSIVNFTVVNNSTSNNTTQPVALATNGTLTIVPGINFGTSTGGETTTLLDAMVESLN